MNIKNGSIFLKINSPTKRFCLYFSFLCGFFPKFLAMFFRFFFFNLQYFFVNRQNKSKHTGRILIVSSFQNQVNKIFKFRFSGSSGQVFATFFENLTENLTIHEFENFVHVILNTRDHCVWSTLPLLYAIHFLLMIMGRGPR